MHSHIVVNHGDERRGLKLALYGQAIKLVSSDSHRLEYVPLLIIIEGTLGYSSQRILKLPELHLHRCLRPCLSWVVRNGFSISLEPIQDVKFQPRSRLLLINCVMLSLVVAFLRDAKTNLVGLS